MTQPTPQERWDAAGKAKDGFEAYDLLYSAWPEPKRARLFTLERDTDVSGISGTGTVADGVVWPDGTVTIRWRGERPSTVNWGRIEDATAVHGHGGATRIVFGDESTAPGIPLRLGIDGPIIGTAVIADDGTMRATVTDPGAAAALSTPPRGISLRFDRAGRERLVHDDPGLAAQIREGIAEAERGETVDLGSFAQYLDEGD